MSGCKKMHEVSLVRELLAMVAENAAGNGIGRVGRVRLVVGEWYGALPEALDFAFRVLSRGTVCARAKLEVEVPPVVFGCRDCGKEFAPGESGAACCPRCGSRGIELKQGKELYVDFYEGV